MIVLKPFRPAALLAVLALGAARTATAQNAPRTAAPAPGPGAAASSQTWQLTYLKAAPGEVEHLAQLIRLNWFAMDARARAAGDIVDYQLLRASPADSTWDLLEITVFADSAQHARADSVYRTVYRPQHRMQLVDGKRFAQLGTIVQSITTRWVGGRP